MTSKDRVRYAFSHAEPDFPPIDYFAAPEIHQALCNHFRVTSEEEIRESLNVDIYYVNPPYIGPAPKRLEDGAEIDMWGIAFHPMSNEYGDCSEPVNCPYAQFKNVEEAESFNWPSPDWFDYDAISRMCRMFPNKAIATGSFAVQDFINGVAFGRGVEQVLIDIAMEDPVYLYIVEKRHRFFLEVIERTLCAASNAIDFVLCGDDFGSQRGLLISPRSFDSIFANRKKEFCDMVHAHGAFVSHHCCGSSVDLFPRFIEAGMDAVQTIQPQAVGMNPYELKRKFGAKMTFHGTIDVQGWLQKAQPETIRNEVFNLLEQIGVCGGFILAPSHDIQPDTPIENVLNVYQSVEDYRKVK